ncbi:MAG: hypothetical protein IKO75_00210 [Bacteroidales bacterium]|nr:hypothetical protein [Bacteroidales bacterium]
MEEFESTSFNKELAEQVDRFLRKEMSEEESLAFVEEVKSNPALREYYQRHFNLMRGINFEQMEKLMKSKEKELSNGRNKTILFKTISIAAAAMFCIVLASDFFVSMHVGSVVLQQELAVVQKGDSDIDSLLLEGKYDIALEEIDKELGIKYELGDDPEAIKAYEQSMNDLKYKKALIYLKQGKKMKAKAILKELDDERANQVLNQLLW